MVSIKEKELYMIANLEQFLNYFNLMDAKLKAKIDSKKAEVKAK